MPSIPPFYISSQNVGLLFDELNAAIASGDVSNLVPECQKIIEAGLKKELEDPFNKARALLSEVRKHTPRLPACVSA